MKKLIYFITFLFVTTTAFAEQLHNFDQIKTAVTDGKLIRLFIDYTKCSMLTGKTMIPNHDAIYTPNAMSITVDGNINSYILYFTMNDPQYPNIAVYQYGKFLLTKENTLELIFSTLKAADYTQLGGIQRLTCKIDDGVNVFVNQQGLLRSES